MLGWKPTRCHTNHTAAYMSLVEAQQDSQVVPNIESETGDSAATKIEKIVHTKDQGKQIHVPPRVWLEAAQLWGQSQKHPHHSGRHELSKLLYGNTLRHSAGISICVDVPAHA